VARRSPRSARDLRRKRGQRPPYDRVLIVCEGKKTEPQYLEEIRKINRVPPVHVRVVHAGRTQPRQIVDDAEALFNESREYEHVYAVFDRDDHATYHNALTRAEQLDNTLRNDEKNLVRFFAVPSVPCFELWLLLHFENVLAFFSRNEILAKLRAYLPGYDKGMAGTYAATEDHLAVASQRAARLREDHSPHTGTDPYTDVDMLVAKLRTIVVKR
jgi:hypothetical protein